MNINAIIANELNVNLKQVDAAVTLLDEGATVPFISRYRKEVTGGLSDTDLRQLEERLGYFRELEERKTTILTSIDSQGKLTPKLKEQIAETLSKTVLEDLYLPYKPKRRTKAQIAREAGLEPLAMGLLDDPTQTPETFAEQFINSEKEIHNIKDALEGAKQILMEHFSENADLLQKLRDYAWNNAKMVSTVQKDKANEDKKAEGEKFKDYFAYDEAICKIPSHRALALFRGRKENILSINLQFNEPNEEKYCVDLIAKTFNVSMQNRAADTWLYQAADWTWKIKLALKIELELFNQLRETAEIEAIKVFQANLSNLLMAAPAGNKVTMGLDPGLRTGVKLVVVDGTGKLLEYITIFPHVPKNEQTKSMAIIAALCEKHKVELVSIGNGTASRETEKLVADTMKQHPQLKITKVVVSEAGASVYSASELAAKEFPELDVTYRGAVSIARRLQDPLAELVKIDPKAIGVGQYQHDVNQIKLSHSLVAVLEDCVNAVGADVNTASVKLLASISGLNETVAQNIVTYRENHGRFEAREVLKKVPRMGEKTYEQAVGFLRILDGKNPLDASAVHPESYPLVEKILQEQKKTLKEIMGNSEFILALNPQKFIDDKFGLPTIKDVLTELQKPGRDPRPEFVTAKFSDGIDDLKDLKVGMQLEGVITNVTNFGAFVDIGVHQDGLVHVSELSDRFIKDPKEAVKVGQIVKVKVLEVDLNRKRVQLTMKSGQASNQTKPTDKPANKFESKPSMNQSPQQPKLTSGFASALAKALK